MARPKKQGLDYFPFDCDFFQDEKVVAIAGEFGLKGEIAIVKLLCAVYRNGYFYQWSDMAKAKLLHELPGVNADLLDQIVSRLVRWGFFDKDLFDSSSVLTSQGIQKRYFEAAKYRKLDADLPYLLSFPRINPNKTTVSHELTGVSPTFTTQSKVKEIKISPDGDTKSAPSPPTTQELSERLNRDAEQLKSDVAWQESVCQVRHVSRDDLTIWIDRFVAHCLCCGKDHSNLGDVKSHFMQWLAIQQSKIPNEQHVRPAVQVRRRRIDEVGSSADDYKKSF
jgi:hypothetical protein